MKNSFNKNLFSRIIDSIPNNFTDNHDNLRFGIIEEKTHFSFKRFVVEKILYPRFIYKWEVHHSLEQTFEFINIYGEKLEFLYKILENEQSRELLVDIIAYRILGEAKVKFSINTKEYWDRFSESYKFADTKDYIEIKFMNWRLYKTDFNKYNFPISIYTMPPAMVTYGYLGQYEYLGKQSIKVEQDDIVLDCGGCYGDTALIFGHQSGNGGRVYSFEFIPSNIEVFEKNIALNKQSVSNVEIITRPVWELSDLTLYFKDNGPGSTVTAQDIKDADGVVETISIDDFVIRKSLSRVDFIKMDIEGAELPSLRGAINTLNSYKPKLAISLYHSMEDFVDIPEFLDKLGLGYKFYLGHYTIHAEETVLYAIV